MKVPVRRVGRDEAWARDVVAACLSRGREAAVTAWLLLAWRSTSAIARRPEDGDARRSGDDGVGEQVGDRHQGDARQAHPRLVRRLSPIVMETRLGTMRPRKVEPDDGDDAGGDGD